jgi:hypothetical protein
MAKADAAVAALRTKLQRMEDEAAARKRIHSTTSHKIVCNKLRCFGQLLQSTVVAAKERALFKWITVNYNIITKDYHEITDTYYLVITTQ